MIKEKTNTEIIQLLGENFHEYRIISGLTQKELSQKAGVSVSTIHKFETGDITNISLSNVLSLMRHTGILDNAMNFIPKQPESPYIISKTKVRHATGKLNKNKD